MTIPYNFQIEGCTGEFSSEINGYLFTRTLKLMDVVEETVGDDADIHQAFSALVDFFVPLVGNDLSHVSLDLTGCWLRNIKANPLGNNQWRVVLQYQHSPFNITVNTIQVSSGTQVSQVESNKDRDGVSITLKYLWPDDYGGESATEDDKLKRGKFSGEQGGTYSRLVPESTRIYKLREERDPKTMRDLVGSVNNADWLDPGDSGNWFFANVTGSTDDSQQLPPQWVNSYSFQYRKDGWKPEVVFTDPKTNEPVPDPEFQYGQDETGFGSKTLVAAYDTINFLSTFPEFT